MTQIYSKLCDFLEIGDNHPTILMGVLNLSPESFFKGSVYEDLQHLEKAAFNMINNGARMLDLGARSTAPWSKKISIDEEINRIIPAMKFLCKKIPKNIILSIDTQYKEVAEKSYKIARNFDINIIINDVSCLKTDPSLADFIIENKLPIILMASKKIPGDILVMDDIIMEFQKTINNLKKGGYNDHNIILDPGIGHWIKEKTFQYDLKIINNINKLRILNKPILVAISRKSFIGSVLKIPEPENRYNGTLSATAIAVYNGAHIIRTHDINKQLLEIKKMAEILRRNK
ncbi:MAG: dihydropteroate synthase [Candidatus Hermodarchaeota archaeon]